MKTIIAEKPSVAREIARIVGATKREEGYFEGGGYAVTWAFGHLVQLAMPDGYGVRGFVRDNLPLFCKAVFRHIWIFRLWNRHYSQKSIHCHVQKDKV